MIPMTITYVYFSSLTENLTSIGEASQLAQPRLKLSIKTIGFLATLGAIIYNSHTARQALNKYIDIVPQTSQL